MELKLVKKELKIDVYGKADVILKFPTVEEHSLYAENLTKDNANLYAESESFLMKMGMKKTLVKELSLDDMLNIVQILTGQKKI